MTATLARKIASAGEKGEPEEENKNENKLSIPIPSAAATASSYSPVATLTSVVGTYFSSFERVRSGDARSAASEGGSVRLYEGHVGDVLDIVEGAGSEERAERLVDLVCRGAPPSRYRLYLTSPIALARVRQSTGLSPCPDSSNRPQPLRSGGGTGKSSEIGKDRVASPVGEAAHS
jgi:hypothetical protein